MEVDAAKFIGKSGKVWAGHLRANRAESSPGEVALFVSDNGPKKRRKETGSLLAEKKKVSAEIYASRTGKLG